MEKGCSFMRVLQRIALALTIIGAINWGLIGFFSFDLVAAIFGGQTAVLSRIIYALVEISGLICISLYSNVIADNDVDEPRRIRSSNRNYETKFASDDNDKIDRGR